MPNALEHRVTAAVVIGSAMAHQEAKNGESTAKPLVGAAGGALLGTLPDILEPASNPNHRQFFHSWAMLGLIGFGLKRAYDWEPKDSTDKFVRGALLVAGAAYSIHLLMDATTSKSLPLIR